MSGRMKRATGIVRTALFGFLVASCGVASADVSQYVFVIQAEDATSGASATWALESPSGGIGEYWDWYVEGPVELKSPTGQVLGVLKNCAGSLVADPAIGLNFLVQAGSNTTNFTITSALLSFPNISPAQGRATVQIGVNDVDGDGATLTGTQPGGKAFLADYNGFVPGGTHFAALISSVATVTPGGVAGESEDFPGGGGYAPIGVGVTNMSSQYRFTLSANDLANGTSFYEIIPEPATLSLLLLGALALRRRS